jgi:putative transposase
MEVQKTIKCKIDDLTEGKRKALEQEFDNLQKYLQKDMDVKLYSANKQQADRFYEEIKEDKEYPISVRKDLIDIQKTDNKVSEYWLKVRVASIYGGINVPIKPHIPIPLEGGGVKYCESKILKKDDKFYFHLTIKKTVQAKKSYSGLLAIDIGQKYLSVSVASHRGQPKFQGRKIRGIRRHYNWLRKRLGEKKLEKEIERLSDKESRKVGQKIHKIAKDLVEEADEHNELIVVGNLKGLRENSKDKGKTMNRIISNFPYYKFVKYLEYKANERGIQVLKMNEHYTSQECSRCGAKGKRPNQGTFKCPRCGYEINADFNGAKNIFQRTKVALGNIPTVGAVSGPALNSSDMVSTSGSPSGETEKGSLFLTNGVS